MRNKRACKSGEVDLDAFKIVYVAPKNEQGQEMVLNNRNRLQPRGAVCNTHLPLPTNDSV